MKFSKFFTDFMDDFFVNANKTNGDIRSGLFLADNYIQFKRLKKVLSMIANGNKIVTEKLTPTELALADSCNGSAVDLFEKMLESQMNLVDQQYNLMIHAIPERLQLAFQACLSKQEDNTSTKDPHKAKQPPDISVSIAESLAMLLQPLGSIFYMLADEVMSIGNYAYMNYTATRKILKKLQRVSSSSIDLLNLLKSSFESKVYSSDQKNLKKILLSLMPGLAVQSSNDLFSAVVSDDLERVRKLLLLQGADPNFKSPSDGKTCLHVAVTNHHTSTKIVSMLISAGASVNAKDSRGCSVLGVALVDDSSDYLECARVVRQAGGDVMLGSIDKEELEGKVQYYAQSGKLNRLKKLWAAGVDLGFALHAAAEGGHIEVVRFLLENDLGGNIHAVNHQGKTPLELVSQKNSDERLVQLLLKYSSSLVSLNSPSAASVTGNSIIVAKTGNKRDNEGIDMVLGSVKIPSIVVDKENYWFDADDDDDEDEREEMERRQQAKREKKVKGDSGTNRFFNNINIQKGNKISCSKKLLYVIKNSLAHIIIPTWLKSYKWKEFLKDDLIAGLSLTGMIIPSSMALASLIGLSPSYGIYSTMFSAMLYAWFGTSPHLCVGPLSVVSLLVGEALSGVDGGATPELACIFCMFVGVVLIFCGVCRLGFLIQFLSGPALGGFTTAAAFLTVVVQINSLLGTTLSGGSSVLLHKVIEKNVSAIRTVHWPTILVSVVSTISVLLLRRYLCGRLFLLSPLIVMIFSIVVSVTFDFEGIGIKTVESIAAGWPRIVRLSNDDFRKMISLFPTASFIGIVGFIESIATAKRWATHFGYTIDNNREFIVLGLANLVMPLTGGIPVFGSLSATAANVSAGGRTPVVVLVRSFLLIVVVLGLARLFSPLPKAVLASILVLSVYKMIDLNSAVKLWKISKSDLLVWVTACVLTLFLGVQVGMASAAVLSLVVFIIRNSYPHIVIMARELGSLHFVPVNNLSSGGGDRGRSVLHNLLLPLTRNDLVRVQPTDGSSSSSSIGNATGVDEKGSLVISFQAPLWYANCDLLKEKALVLLGRPKVHTVVIDFSAVSFIDSTALDVLKELADTVDAKMPGKILIICCVVSSVVSRLVGVRLHERLNGVIACINTGEDLFANSIYEGVRRANFKRANIKHKAAHNQIKQ